MFDMPTTLAPLGGAVDDRGRRARLAHDGSRVRNRARSGARRHELADEPIGEGRQRMS